jgi:serine/threonine protein kinase
VPKVIDFGIAKATQGELTEKTVYTQFQQFIGTPAYMSPEQADMTSLDIDTRSDIYALGVLLYELLVGQTPFDAKLLLMSGLDEMRRTIREKEPIRPSTRLESLLGEERTTTAKRRGADMAKLTALLVGKQIPDDDRTVAASGSHRKAVRGSCERVNPAGVTFERGPRFRPRGDIPSTDHVIGPAREQSGVFLREGCLLSVWAATNCLVQSRPRPIPRRFI